MDTKDLRRPAVVRSRKNNILNNGQVIDFDLVEDVETLFDRDNFVSDIENLLDNRTIDNDEVLTIPEEMAPIAGVRFGVEPKIRKPLRKRLENGTANQIITPDPKAKVFVTVGWPEVRVSPTGEFTVQIEHISGPKGGRPDDEDVDALSEAISNHTYFLTVRGETYPIDSLEGSVLTLEVPQNFSVPSYAIIHNNARKLFLTTERFPASDPTKESTTDRSRRRSKDQSISTFGPVSPVLSVDTLVGEHTVSITAEGKGERKSLEMVEDIQMDQPPEPEYTGGAYNVSKPPEDPVQGQRLVRQKSNLTIGVNLKHPRDNAMILGIKYRVGVQSKDGGYKFEEPNFVNFSHEILSWELKDVEEIESTNREFLVLLGDYVPLMRRKVQMKFVDEMGRTILEKNAIINPLEPGKGNEFRPNQQFISQFGELAYQSATPVDIDLKSWYDRGSKKFEELMAKAERVAKGRDIEEVQRENVEKPIADIRITDTSGLSVDFDASQSEHPNGLNLEYRFDFTSDGAWDTIWTDDATASYSYPEGGNYKATVEVRDEVDQRDRAAVSVSVST